MTICFVNDFSEGSGAGRYSAMLYAHLRRDFDIQYLYLNHAAGSLDEKRGDGYVAIARAPRFGGQVWAKPLFWHAFKGKLPRHDLYHLMTPNISFLAGQGRTVVTCHDIAPLFMPVGPLERIGRRILYSGLRRSSLLIADSEATKADIVRAYGADAPGVRVIPLGVDHDRFKPYPKGEARARLGLPGGSKIILSVSLEMWRKNIPGTVRAFARVRQHDPSALLVRSTAPSPATAALVESLGIGGSVRYFPALTEDQLPLLYSAADALLFPSFYEGFGLPALEAMACGCPVVASNLTSVPEVVGEAGMLVDPEDEERMAGAVARVISDDEYADSLRRAGIERAARFTWERTARMTADVYRTALSAG